MCKKKRGLLYAYNKYYLIPNNGIIVLSNIDYNSYINGTLSFNYNDDMLLS